MKNQSKKQLKKKKRNHFYFIIIIVLIIILLGWFWKSELEDKEISSENDIGISEKERLLIELNTINEKINIYYKKEAYLIREKDLFFLYARLLLGVFILGLNYLYFVIYKTYTINDFLSVNQIILFSYSFLAFLTYGTLDNFSNNIKSKVIYFLHKNDMYFKLEITNLNARKELITKQLLDLTD